MPYKVAGKHVMYFKGGSMKCEICWVTREHDPEPCIGCGRHVCIYCSREWDEGRLCKDCCEKVDAFIAGWKPMVCRYPKGYGISGGGIEEVFISCTAADALYQYMRREHD